MQLHGSAKELARVGLTDDQPHVLNGQDDECGVMATKSIFGKSSVFLIVGVLDVSASAPISNGPVYASTQLVRPRTKASCKGSTAQ